MFIHLHVAPSKIHSNSKRQILQQCHWTYEPRSVVEQAVSFSHIFPFGGHCANHAKHHNVPSTNMLDNLETKLYYEATYTVAMRYRNHTSLLPGSRVEWHSHHCMHRMEMYSETTSLNRMELKWVYSSFFSSFMYWWTEWETWRSNNKKWRWEKCKKSPRCIPALVGPGSPVSSVSPVERQEGIIFIQI